MFIDKQEVLHRISLFDLMAGLKIDLPQRGRGHDKVRMPCPLHKGKNDSFAVYNDKTWKCFSKCGQGGDAIAFYMAWKDCNFKRALVDLAKIAGVKTERNDDVKPIKLHKSRVKVAKKGLSDFVEWAMKQLHKQQAILDKLYAFGWSFETIKAWRLGYNPQWFSAEWGKVLPGIVYPYFEQNTPFWLNVRRLSEGKPKYLGINGGHGFFGLDKTTMKDTLVLTEGEKDCITMWQAVGDLVDVMTLGGSSNSLSVSDAIRLLPYKRIISIYDNDKAGQDGLSRIGTLSERIEIECLPSLLDVTDFVIQWGQSVLREFILGLLRTARLTFPSTIRFPNKFASVLVPSYGSCLVTFHSRAEAEVTLDALERFERHSACKARGVCDCGLGLAEPPRPAKHLEQSTFFEDKPINHYEGGL